ncbi:MAG: extracellular solute-binding protein [Clostridia bacterium]|nr:extracellular solute-binding protein [Clostridia bacterium]
MKKSKIFGNIYTVLAFIFLYMPIAVLVIFSFNASDSTGNITGFSLKWYGELFSDAATLNALKNTLILAILSSIIATVIGTMASYGINKMQNKHIKSATMSVTKIPMINPEIVVGISMMLLFVFVGGIVGSQSSLGFGTVLIAHITFNLPYVILSVLPKFKQMDKSLPEAAQDLGCTPLQSFFKVELPAILPGVVSGLIMAFTLSLDDFVISYFTIGSGFETLPIRIYSMTKKRVTPDMYALSTLIFVSILVLLLISNLTSDKSREKMSKKAKKITKIVVGSLFGVIAAVTIVVFIVSASTETLTLNVYNWGEYISDGGEDTLDVNQKFEEYYEDWYFKKYNKRVKVNVNYTTYASNEDLYAKIKSGAADYDIIVPSDYMVERLKSEGLLQTIDLSKIPNYENISEQFRNPYYDNGKEKYSVMYTYGIVGIVYNKDKINDDDLAKIEAGEAGWELLWDEDYKGQILQFNNARDAFGVAMYSLGIDVNNATDAEWQKAYERLKEQKPLVQSYVMDEIFNKMEGGEAALAAYYAGDCLSMIERAAEAGVNLGFYYPKTNGKYVTNIFADAMCIPKSATNVELAHAYINYMLSEEPAVANAEYLYYGSPNKLVVNNGDYIDYLGDDYGVIYQEEFESQLDYMFETYAYRSLPDEKLKLQNNLWETLKVGSDSFDSGIYVICGVIAAVLIGFGVYCYIIKRKRRRLYWNTQKEASKK